MNLPVTNTTQTGIRGENLTADFLLNQGYELLDKNYRFKKYEIDLVLRDQSTLVFVEVKFRSTDMFCEPWKSVTRKKQQQIIQVANHYVQTKELDYEVRFDVVGIVASENGLQIDHIQDAFYPIA
jgi:putative endonuclease